MMVDKKGFISWIVTWKFRADQIASFLTYINYSLLIITSAPNVYQLLTKFGVVTDVYTVIACMFIATVLFVLIFGWLLDQKIQYFQNLQTVQNVRNPQIAEILENTRQLRKELDDIKTKIR